MADDRTDTEQLADLISDEVLAALKEPDEDRRQQLLSMLATTAFNIAYERAGGEGIANDANHDFVAALLPAFGLLVPDGTDAQHDRMRAVIAHGAMNAATVAAQGGSGVSFEWRTMRDDRVRDMHQPVDGQVRAAGQLFDVGGHQLAYPGQPVGPPEVWMNCRCRLVPRPPSTTAAASPPRGAVMVARPADPESIAVEGGLPADELHVTLGYYGDADSLDPEVSRLLEQFANTRTIDVRADVGGFGTLGNDDPPATVLFLEAEDLASLRSTLELVAAPDATHPHFTPHLTLGYGIDMPTEVPPAVHLNRVELWRGGERIGGDMPEEVAASVQSDVALIAVSDTPWSQFSASDYTLAQWKRACLLTMPGGDPESKGTYKIPVREPGGALNRNGVHAAAAALAGARGGVSAPAEAKAAAKRKLRGLYRQIGDEIPDSLAADGEELVAWAPSTSPPGTHDAPGWATNPRETQRLRDYWTKGAGAAKIGWGSPGDLTRCEQFLAKYVGPQHSWGTCQNLHKEALGIWNPESGGRKGDGFDEITEAFAAAALLEVPMLPSVAYFEDPHLDGPTPQTIRAAGDGLIEYVGHLAAWDTCHVGISGQCVTAPRTASGYAHFRLGEVDTDQGPIPVGHITAGTGHAATDLTASDTVAHYDNTGTVVADVAVGEDDYGIWAHGLVRPGVTEDQLHALRAGVPSGDWRRIGGNLELVGALIVNVPGFPIPRPELAASAGRDLALVAAGVVTIDPNAIDDDRIVVAVTRALDERDAATARRQRADALLATMGEHRAERLLAAVGD